MRARTFAVFLVGASWLTGTSVLAAKRDASPLEAAGVEQQAPHPEPRVIVNVLSVRGPHDPDSVQRDARLAWGRIVRCYKEAGERERTVVKLELTVTAAGKVAHARTIHAERKDRELARCLASAYRGLGMPQARARSTAEIEIRLAPGDRAPKGGGPEARSQRLRSPVGLVTS